jgi:hypothetical protein
MFRSDHGRRARLAPALLAGAHAVAARAADALTALAWCSIPSSGGEVLKPPKLPRRLVVLVRLPQCRHQFPQCEYETPPIIDRGSDLQRHFEVPDRVGPVTEAELGREVV